MRAANRSLICSGKYFCIVCHSISGEVDKEILAITFHLCEDSARKIKFQTREGVCGVCRTRGKASTFRNHRVTLSIGSRARRNRTKAQKITSKPNPVGRRKNFKTLDRAGAKSSRRSIANNPRRIIHEECNHVILHLTVPFAIASRRGKQLRSSRRKTRLHR